MRPDKKKQTRKQGWEGKQLYGYFKLQISETAHVNKTLTRLRNGNLQRETEGLLVVAQNSAIKINYDEGALVIRNRIANVRQTEKKMKRLNLSEYNEIKANRVKLHRSSTRLGMNWKERRFTGNCASIKF